MSGHDFNTPWEGVSGFLAAKARNGENQARPADSLSWLNTTGAGEIQVENAVTFRCVFIEEPHFTYGYRVDEELGDELVLTQLPRSWGFVVDYVTNARGHYLGAYMNFIVEVPIGDENPQYAIRHYLRFQGIGMKAIRSEEAAG